MYYEEKLINGILYYKLMPKMDWQPIEPEILAKRIISLEKRIKELTLSKQ